jgi:hypothetical protein
LLLSSSRLFGGCVSSGDGSILNPKVDAGAENPVENDSSNVNTEVNEKE